jgi:alpha-galactosidase
MLRLPLFVLLTLWCTVAPLFGNDITGRWRLLRQSKDGNTLVTFLELKQQGSNLQGTLMLDYGDIGISDGHVRGDKVAFIVNIAPTYSFRYTGTVGQDQMKLSQYDPNIGWVPATAIRMKANESITPPRLPLPDLHAVEDNRLARTPPMGWNSWNFFHDKIDDHTVREIADAMVSSGMQKAGYLYINIDDTWEGTRDEAGRIRSNNKFPNMRRLSDYVHSKGLKLGIYSSPGPRTCGGYEGSYGHEQQDAITYAEWGIDYLKYDWCSAFRIYKDSEMRPVYQKMGDALRQTGRPIIYSLCQYGRNDVWKWAKLVDGNLWRTTEDIRDNANSMISNAEAEADLSKWAEPGHWNDPDMLEIGNGGMSQDEYRMHMTWWAMLAAPLIAGNDLRNMNQDTVQILTNAEVIAIDQDPLGKHGQRVKKDGDVEIWTRSLQGNAVAIAIMNLGNENKNVTVGWHEFGIDEVKSARELWHHLDLPNSTGYSATLERHGAVLIRVQQ